MAPPFLAGAAAAADESMLPTLHWFVADLEKARSDVPTPSEVFFDAGDGRGIRYYSYVNAHRTGSERCVYDGRTRLSTFISACSSSSSSTHSGEHA